jgi:hypothetical protein
MVAARGGIDEMSPMGESAPEAASPMAPVTAVPWQAGNEGDGQMCQKVGDSDTLASR